MSRIALIGSGISGLASAYYLSRHHEVSLFEKDDRLGGHTHTHTVETSAGPVPIDSGFVVHNEKTYPNFCSLMAELGVRTQRSDMSFAVSSGDGAFEYSGRGLGGFFAQKRNLLKPAHYLLLKEILRFNREAPLLLDREGGAEVTLQEFLKSGQYRDIFIERYLYPMTSAVWSTSLDQAGQFPAATLIRFFQNHGLLGIGGHPLWKTLVGGSHSYIEPITTPYRNSIHLGAQIRTVIRSGRAVRLEFKDRPSMEFDEVVFACHGNQVLPLLDSPTAIEREVFTNFKTSRNDACLHTDARMLPRRPAARASWNYLLGGDARARLTYDMNRLQLLAVDRNYCVTLNANDYIAPDRVIQKMVYFHPLYTREAVVAQGRWGEVSGRNRTHYCGAYWFYGFHEDGVRSALRVASSLGSSVREVEAA